MTTIKTTWGKIFENDHLVLFNNFPEILNDLGRYEELYQWYESDDEEDMPYEVYQWYIIPSDFTVEWLQRYCPEIAADVHYSETIGHYILAVYHLGTHWSYVPATLEVEDKAMAHIYQKTYHDDLPDDVLRNVFGEKTKEDIAYGE